MNVKSISFYLEGIEIYLYQDCIHVRIDIVLLETIAKVKNFLFIVLIGVPYLYWYPRFYIQFSRSLLWFGGINLFNNKSFINLLLLLLSLL